MQMAAWRWRRCHLCAGCLGNGCGVLTGLCIALCLYLIQRLLKSPAVQNKTTRFTEMHTFNKRLQSSLTHQHKEYRIAACAQKLSIMALVSWTITFTGLCLQGHLMQKLTMEFLRKVKVFAVGVLCIPQEVYLQKLQDWKFGSAA